ncbi:MAG: hypothetical protein HC876_13995 [Chloroflexaceae bacterium]|nr:hypothetical protein [Chloroflexaceae bacterium]
MQPIGHATFPIRNASNHIAAIASVLSAATEYTQLGERVELYEALLERAPLCMAVWTLGRNPMLRYANAAHSALFGPDANEQTVMLSHLFAEPVEQQVLERVFQYGYWSGDQGVYHCHGYPFVARITLFVIRDAHTYPVALGSIITHAGATDVDG